KPPTRPNQTTEITHIYDRGEAYDVIRRSQEDYHKHFGDLKQSLLAPLRDS
ncbi:MAG: inorganic pyrophosphatase, partial [Gemmatimonadetes bacterium]|nr:inorganic pyrophosphatase [Gemmatimonadota bacterium]